MSQQRQRVRLTIPLAKHLLQTHQISTLDLISYCHALAQYGEETLSLNAFSNLFSKHELLAQAQESHQRYHHYGIRPLEGIPISIKANIATSQSTLTASSQILDSTPGYDSHVVTQLQKAGAILIGVTEMDEFGMGSLGTHSTHKGGAARNPLYVHKEVNEEEGHKQQIGNLTVEDWISNLQSCTIPNCTHTNHYLSAGGSSSGSAVSVSHGSSLASLATDTGGSIRLPAAWNGIVGFKPSYGQISRRGVVSYASSLDTVGVLGNSVDCVNQVWNVVRNGTPSDEEEVGVAVGDSTASWSKRNVQIPPLASSSFSWKEEFMVERDSLKGLKVGIPEAFCVEECPPDINQAWEASIQALERCGAQIEIIPQNVIQPQTVGNALPAYYVLTCAEASSNLARYDGLRYGLKYEDINNDSSTSTSSHPTSSILQDMNPRERQYATVRARGFGPEVKRRILCGTAVLSSDRFHTHYEAASYIRATMTRELTSAFRTKEDMEGEGSDTGVDLILIPTALTHPPDLVGEEREMDPTEAFQNDVMTIPFSLAGLPSISVPVWLSKSESVRRADDDVERKVVGMQLVGPRLSEERVLQIAHVLQDTHV